MGASVAKDYDVIVVGGGPAGASASVHLATRGARVLLVEREKFPRAKLCGEFISPECLSHFARLGVLESMSGAGGARVGETLFFAQSGRRAGVPSEWFGRETGGAYAGATAGALGLSRAEMDERLLRRARAVGVEVLEEAPVTGLLFEGEGRRAVGGVRVEWHGESLELRAPVTIDATGRARSLARRVEQRTKANNGGGAHAASKAGGAASKRMPLVAFKAHLENAGGAAGACEIYFYRGGYGGLSCVENELSNLCFIVAARDVRARASDASRVMREIVMSNSRAAETLRGARVRSEWLAVGLESFGRREPVPAEGLLMVGDAASFIDPFTGSGMLMALESGELACEAVINTLPQLRAGVGFAQLAADYRVRYQERFAARLRVCSWLRRVAFAPQFATEAAIAALGASERMRRVVARATRPA
jgi:menaquinone-9 beta-reductase